MEPIIEVTIDSENNVLHVSATSDNPVESIYIDTQDTFNCQEEPSSSAIHIDKVESYQDEDKLWHIDMDIELNNYSLGVITDPESSLYFVFIRLVKIVGYWMNYTYDETVLMDSIFNTLFKSLALGKCCEDVNNVPVDIILLYNAFLAAENCNDKIFFWEKIYDSLANGGSSTSNCKCHGT